MTDKEKAEAYDEAIKKAESLYKVAEPMSGCNVIIETLFPELKESDDEKIRKELLEHCKSQAEPYIQTGNKCPQIQSWIDWLEKQGEQKSLDDVIKEVTKNKETATSFLKSCGIMNTNGELADEYKIEREEPQVYETEDGEVITYSESEGYKVIEPKFHEGDLVVDNCDYVWKIEGILNQFYILEGIEGGESRPTIEWVDKTFHLWTIQDAKDGDMLADYAGVILFRKIGNERYADVVDYYCVVNTNGRFEIQGKFGYWGKANEAELHPATKEQRDLLFQKMKEEGYEWDAEKKELKKIEKRSSWSEEDERIYRGLHNLIYSTPYCNSRKELSDFLDSLKNRVQPKQEWSEEDKYMYDILCGTIENTDINENTKYTLISWLKSLKGRVQPKQEWSRDDEQYLLVCKNALAKYQTTDKWDAGIISRWLEDKLKSLRQRKGE